MEIDKAATPNVGMVKGGEGDYYEYISSECKCALYRYIIYHGEIRTTGTVLIVVLRR